MSLQEYRRPQAVSAIVSLWSLVVALSASADYFDETGFTKLQAELGGATPDGTGVPVAQTEALEGGSRFIPQTSPQPIPHSFIMTGSVFGGKTLTVESSGTVTASGHASTVGQYFFGLRQNPASGPSSMAPGVTQVRSFDAGGYIFGGIPVTRDDKVHSAAWISNDPQYNAELRTLDREVDAYGFLPVAGVNNGASSAIPVLLVSAYNVLSVGRTDGLHSSGTTPAGTAMEPVDGPGRIKPEVVAPYTTTSWATGGVSGMAALLYEVAAGNGALANAEDESEVMKAIIMAGATKQEFPTWSRTQGSPLDATFGAGEVNVYESHAILEAGEQNPGGAIGLRGWDFDAVTSGPSVEEYTITIPDGFYANELSIVATWNRYRQGFNYIVHDLDLRLVDAGGGPVEWDRSDSLVDNVEHIYYRNLPPGEYVIRLTRNGSNSSTTDYAIAWRTVLGKGPQLEPDPDAVDTLDFSNLDPNATYTVQRTTDIDTFTVWTDEHTFSPDEPTHQWIDPTASGSRVYYRLVWDLVTN